MGVYYSQYKIRSDDRAKEGEMTQGQAVGMKKHVLVTKVDFIEPYKVQLFPNLSMKAKAEITWTFRKLSNALEIGQGLAKDHEAYFSIFGDEVVSESNSLFNNNMNEE